MGVVQWGWGGYVFGLKIFGQNFLNIFPYPPPSTPPMGRRSWVRSGVSVYFFKGGSYVGDGWGMFLD